MNEKLLRALEQISDEHITQAATRRKTHRPYWIGTIAAMLAVAILAGVFLTLPQGTGNNAATEPVIPEPVTPAPPVLEMEWSEGCSFDDLISSLSDRIDSGELTYYTVDISGLCTPVSVQMYAMDVHLVEVYGHIIDQQMGQFQDTSSLQIQQWGDAIILQHMEDVCLGAWIATADRLHEQLPSDDTCTEYYVDDQGQLCYQCYIPEYATTLEQDPFAPIALFNSRDAFVYAEGVIETIDSTGIIPAYTRIYTASDLYDLDAVFAEAQAAGLYTEYASVDDLFAKRQTSEEDTPDGLVLAQKLTGVHISQYNGAPVTYDFHYEGSQLQEMIYTQGDYLRLETAYDSSYRRPLATSVYRILEGQEELEHHYSYTYDAQGNCITAVYNTQFGQYIRREEYSYNASGQRVQCDIFWNDVKDAVVTYEYDDAGNLVRELSTYEEAQTFYDSDKPQYITFTSTEYTYDGQGRVTKKALADDNGIYNTFTYTYDEAGRKTDLSDVTDYQYDENGLLQSLTLFGEPVTFEYEAVYVTREKAQEMLDVLNDVLGEWDLAYLLFPD